MGDARLLDPAALDQKRSPRGRLSIVVPTKWLRDGARLEVDVPAKVRCDLCDGGGCDACGRSGAYRSPEARAPLSVTLPRVSDDVFALRLTNPFGEEEPALLVVRVAGGTEPSAGVRWVAENHDVEPKIPSIAAMPSVPRWLPWVLLALIAALAGYFTRGR